MSAPAEWVVQFTEDIDIPGWFFIPEGVGTDEQNQWVAENAHELRSLVGTNRWDGEPATETDIEDILRLAFDERASTDSDALFQVWPVPFPATVLCHLNLVASSTLPSWRDVGGIVHPLSSPHLGDGVQVSTRGIEDGVEVSSVHLVFSNGDVALMLSVEEAPALLVARVLPELMFLSEALRLERPDGTPFVGTLPTGQLAEESPWGFEEAQ